MKINLLSKPGFVEFSYLSFDARNRVRSAVNAITIELFKLFFGPVLSITVFSHYSRKQSIV